MTYKVIPAGYTPEDWAAFGPGIMARLRSELAEFAKEEPAEFVRWRGRKEIEDEALARFVHTYKGEGLTACGLEVVGPCPGCEQAT